MSGSAGMCDSLILEKTHRYYTSMSAKIYGEINEETNRKSHTVYCIDKLAFFKILIRFTVGDSL